MADPNFNNIDTSRSYATEDNLLKALATLGLTQFRPLVVLNRSHRFTAVFPVSAFKGDVTRAARHGFHTMG